nr:ORF 2 in plasmid pNB2 [Thermoanaerobacterium thermosaccharolyticum]
MIQCVYLMFLMMLRSLLLKKVIIFSLSRWRGHVGFPSPGQAICLFFSKKIFKKVLTMYIKCITI